MPIFLTVNGEKSLGETNHSFCLIINFAFIQLKSIPKSCALEFVFANNNGRKVDILDIKPNNRP